jgi:acetylornithine aminotransferase
MGALALTGQPAKQDPFRPLPGDVRFVPYGDVPALDAATDASTAAVFLEPVQGEGGVLPPPDGYLVAAQHAAHRAGALLVLDEVQTGIGRTGAWFAHQSTGARPDVVTLAKGLGGGLPIGACVALGDTAGLMTPGLHGSTFGGNPVACAAALAVLDTIERDGLLERAKSLGERITDGVLASGHPLVEGVRGSGLLLGVVLTDSVAKQAQAALADDGFLVNAVTTSVLRLAPPLVLSDDDADAFCAALPGALDRVGSTATVPVHDSAERRSGSSDGDPS